MTTDTLPPRIGEGGGEADGWGRLRNHPPELRGRPHPTPAASALPLGGRESGGSVLISGYASLWGQADLNGDVVSRGAFRASLQRTGAEGVRMLHGHEARVVVGVWETLAEDERGLFVRGRIEDWSAEARYAQSLARAGALDGLSIGFRTAKARRDGRLRVLSAVELWEVSLVTFPMLPAARFRVGV